MNPDSPPAALHHLLLGLDGRLPDELVSEARSWLAQGLLVDVAQAVVFTAVTSRDPLTLAETAVLAETLRGAGADTSALAEIEPAAAPPLPSYGLAATGPATPGGPSPNPLDLTDGCDGPNPLDALDTTLLAALPQVPRAEGVWRSWRHPAAEAGGPAPKRTYLVQISGSDLAASGDPALSAVAAELQDVLRGSGETDPLVQVFTDEQRLPGQHRAALDCAALLWAAGPRPAIRVADVPGFGPEHPRLDGPDRDRALAYLRQGTPLLTTAIFLDDALDPAGTGLVPTDLRTDGEWIWSDIVTYYLDRHRLAPEARLLSQLRQRDFTPPEVGPVGLHRARAALWQPTRDPDVHQPTGDPEVRQTTFDRS